MSGTFDVTKQLRFWNHQWRENRNSVLPEIGSALLCRTGCVVVMRKIQNQRFIPPKIERSIEVPKMKD
jgi:hypothetical protein